MNSKKTFKKNINKNNSQKKSKKSKKLNSNIKYRKLNKQYTKKKIYVGRGGGKLGRYITRKVKPIFRQSTGVKNIAFKDIKKTRKLMGKAGITLGEKTFHTDVRNIQNLNKAIDYWREKSKNPNPNINPNLQRKVFRNLALLQANKAKVQGYMVKTTRKIIKKKIERYIKMGPEKMFEQGKLTIPYNDNLINYINEYKNQNNLNFDTIMKDPTLKKIYTSFPGIEKIKKFYAKDTNLNTKDLNILINGKNQKIRFNPVNGRYEAPNNVSIEDIKNIKNSNFSESIKVELIQGKNESFHNFLITKNTDESKKIANELLTKINEDAPNTDYKSIFDISKPEIKFNNNQTRQYKAFYEEFSSRAYKGLNPVQSGNQPSQERKQPSRSLGPLQPQSNNPPREIKPPTYATPTEVK